MQFPEETCVDETDRLCWSGPGYTSSSSSCSSTCSEIEQAFSPPGWPGPRYCSTEVETSLHSVKLGPVQNNLGLPNH